jgi:hypothetical protein
MKFPTSCPTLLHELERAGRRARHGASAPFLRTAGLVDLLDLPEYPPWGIDFVSADDEFYQTEPYPDGTTALIVPAIENLSLVDLVAVSLDTGAVRTRYGIAEYVGYNALRDSEWDQEPLAVFDDAVSWLRAGGNGVYFVDWTQIHVHLQGLPQLVCQTAALAQRVKQAFEQAIPCPPLLVSSDAKETSHAA